MSLVGYRVIPCSFSRPISLLGAVQCRRMDWEETLGDQKPEWDSQFDGADGDQVAGRACAQCSDGFTGAEGKHRVGTHRPTGAAMYACADCYPQYKDLRTLWEAA